MKTAKFRLVGNLEAVGTMKQERRYSSTQEWMIYSKRGGCVAMIVVVLGPFVISAVLMLVPKEPRLVAITAAIAVVGVIGGLLVLLSIAALAQWLWRKRGYLYEFVREALWLNDGTTGRRGPTHSKDDEDSHTKD